MTIQNSTLTAPATTAADIAQAPPATHVPVTSKRSTVGERVAALNIDVPAEIGDATSTDATKPSVEKPVAPGVAATPTDAATNAAARQARIAKMREEERAQDAERQQSRAHKDQKGEVEKLRARIAELEPHTQKFKSPSDLLAYAEKEGMTAEDVVKELRARLEDPAAIAKRATQTVEEKLRAEIAAERKAREDLQAKLEEQAEQSRAQHEATQKASTFIEQSGAKKDTHPLTAALLVRHGARGLVAFANKFVAPLLREDYSLEELHDHTEQLLDEIQVGGASPAPATPANGPSHPPKKNGAAEPVTTLSNALASERTTVSEELPLHRLSKAERIRRARESA